MCPNNTPILRNLYVGLNVEKIGRKGIKSYVVSAKVAIFHLNETKIDKRAVGIDIKIYKTLYMLKHTYVYVITSADSFFFTWLHCYNHLMLSISMLMYSHHTENLPRLVSIVRCWLVKTLRI